MGRNKAEGQDGRSVAHFVRVVRDLLRNLTRADGGPNLSSADAGLVGVANRAWSQLNTEYWHQRREAKAAWDRSMDLDEVNEDSPEAKAACQTAREAQDSLCETERRIWAFPQSSLDLNTLSDHLALLAELAMEKRQLLAR
jgi:hypothetical protein